jgi:hypothetical protein
MRFNKTRKNKKNQDKKSDPRCQYSEGFIRRMTDDITFVPYNPPPEELKRLNEIFDKMEKMKAPMTDDEINEWVTNFPKNRAAYLESIQNKQKSELFLD